MPKKQLKPIDQLSPAQIKRKLGRPTKYNDSYITQAVHYLKNYKELGEEVPTRAGLSLFLGLTRETVNIWASDPEKEVFSDIVRSVDAKQESELISGGLSGKLNPRIVALALSKHGYTTASQDGSGVSITVNVDRSCGDVIEGEVVKDD